jgi:hypothetical protein
MAGLGASRGALRELGCRLLMVFRTEHRTDLRTVVSSHLALCATWRSRDRLSSLGGRARSHLCDADGGQSPRSKACIRSRRSDGQRRPFLRRSPPTGALARLFPPPSSARGNLERGQRQGPGNVPHAAGRTRPSVGAPRKGQQLLDPKISEARRSDDCRCGAEVGG